LGIGSGSGSGCGIGGGEGTWFGFCAVIGTIIGNKTNKPNIKNKNMCFVFMCFLLVNNVFYV